MGAAGAVDCVHDGGEVGLVDSGLRVGQHFGDAFAAQKPTEQPCRCTADDRARLVNETFHVPAERLRLSAPLVRDGRFRSGVDTLGCRQDKRSGELYTAGGLRCGFRDRINLV